ncbi:hypothetical protein [Neptunicella sp. SCSIO 80796]|uniref:hypothetical protein n=1 Tax=Neptunicella plasticusilytica TaxID=3117012 RepID=UPI003A4D2A43
MSDVNFIDFDYPDLHIKVRAELQTVPLRIFIDDEEEFNAVTTINAAGAGEGWVKLLLIDKSKRHRTKQVHEAIQRTMLRMGFPLRFNQRVKAGKFITTQRKIKIKRKL